MDLRKKADTTYKKSPFPTAQKASCREEGDNIISFRDTNFIAHFPCNNSLMESLNSRIRGNIAFSRRTSTRMRNRRCAAKSPTRYKLRNAKGTTLR